MKQYTFYVSGKEPMHLRNPVLETNRIRGLDSMTGTPHEDTILRDILYSWSDGRRYCEEQFTTLCQDAPFISESVLNGSLWPDLGDIWVNGCANSPSCCSNSSNNAEGSSVVSVSTHEEGTFAVTLLHDEVLDIFKNVVHSGGMALGPNQYIPGLSGYLDFKMCGLLLVFAFDCLFHTYDAPVL